MAAERLMTVAEWGALIGVSRADAYRKVARGEVDRTDVGTPGYTRTRISESAHRKYVERHGVAGPSRKGRAA